MSFKEQIIGCFTLNKQLTPEQYETILNFLDDSDTIDNDPKVKDSWCCWDIYSDRKTISRNSSISTHNHIKWLQFLIDKFFKPWELIVSGEVKYRGKDWDTICRITVTDNCISIRNTIEEKDKKISELEKYIAYLEEHIKCSPDGELALAAKEHFIKLIPK